MKFQCVVPILFTCALAQLKFSSSTSKGDNTNTKQKQVDTKFFTGNEAIDGGIVGLGAGLLGGAVLSGVLGGGNNGCGRRKRQADGTNTKFLGALLGGGSGGCNCGRRKRQAPGEDQPGTRFFGLFGGGNNNCCNCPPQYNNNNGGYNSGYNNGYNSGYNNGYNNGVSGSNNGSNNGYNSGYNNGSTRCKCDNRLVFQDKYGATHGACKRGDETGKRWCYTTGYGCQDARQSQRFPNNPWSYIACQYQG